MICTGIWVESVDRSESMLKIVQRPATKLIDNTSLFIAIVCVVATYNSRKKLCNINFKIAICETWMIL